jgi:uncharacterized SAM-binding protein YcdF (DUF218 family)
MRRLFRFVFQLIALAVFFFLISAAVMIFDGLNDRGDKADAAVVIDARVPAKGAASPVLDRAVEMHRSGEVNVIVVISSKWLGEGQEGGSEEMAKYLESHGVPAGDIIKSDHGGSMQETSHAVAQIVEVHKLETVMVVADYYDVTRLKLALGHEGVKNVQSVHVGTVTKDDAFKIIDSVVALYQYVGKVYLLPEAEEGKKEAESGLDKAKVEADHAKDKVDKGLNNLPN